MKKALLLIIAALILTACSTQPAPPVTALFTAQIDLTSPNGDSVTVYVGSIQQSFPGDGSRPDMDFFGVLCAVISSGDSGKCYGKDVKLLLDTLPVKSLKSGCWQAVKQGDDYTVPVPC